jgi:hypothetical protein
VKPLIVVGKVLRDIWSFKVFRIGTVVYVYGLCTVCAIIAAQNSWTLDPSVNRALPAALLAVVQAVIGNVGAVFFCTRSMLVMWLGIVIGSLGLGIALGAFYAILFR